MASEKTGGTASEQVCQQIRENIAGGVWPAGTKIPSENKLAELYGVSRVTVRAAIQRLASLGLLESRQGGGTFVCNPGVEHQLDPMIPFFALSRSDSADVFEFRKIIEVGAVALAAERVTPEMLARMRECCHKMEQARNLDEMAEFDLEFHSLVTAATGNPIFEKVFDVLLPTYRAMFEQNVEVLGTEGVSYHYMITYALEARDGELAQTLMQRHLERASRGMDNMEELSACQKVEKSYR